MTKKESSNCLNYTRLGRPGKVRKKLVVFGVLLNTDELEWKKIVGKI